LARKVEIVDVTARDGIQNEDKILSLEEKRTLIEMSVAAGVRRMEVVSFVNPKRVPQMAGGEELIASLPPRKDVRLIGLVLNRRGFERALGSGVDEINVVVVATDTFNRRNQGVPTFDTVAMWNDIATAARGRIDAGVTIGAAFGCPFEGEVPIDRLLSVVEALAEQRPLEIGLADTIGAAGPGEVLERVAAVRERFPEFPIRCHFHNTRNTGLANAWAAIEAGAVSLDASLAGAGGCPFAPKATGNIPLEDLVYMLERSGIETGIDLDRAIDAARWIEQTVERPQPGQLMKAGVFPPPATAHF